MNGQHRQFGYTLPKFDSWLKTMRNIATVAS
jgi:hypothetical protein